MRNREKILLIGFLVVIFFGLLRESIMSFALDSIRQSQSRLKVVEGKAEAVDQEKNIALAKLQSMNEWKRQSLPPSPETATLVYKEWLHDLAEVAVKLSNVKVTPERMSVKRNKSYVGIQIKVTAEGNIDRIHQFLYRFYQTDLLHRVVNLNLESQQNQGDPILEMTLIAEGLSLQNAAPSLQDALFARAKLVAAAEPEATSLTVDGTEFFPDTVPFRARIDGEYVNVTKIDGKTWTITRGADSSTAMAHETGATVELAPIKAAMSDSTLSEFASLVELNPFAKPMKYVPKLEIIGTRAIARGEVLLLEAKPTGFDPKKGKVVLTIEDVAAELKELAFDQQTGKISWTAGEKVELGDYKFTLKAFSDAVPEPISEIVVVTVRNLNTAPVIEKVENQTAIIGQEFALSIKANDKDEPANKLAYSLAEGAPAGSAIDANSGELKWTPDVSTEPGRVELTVNVTDDGSPPQSASLKLAIDLLDDAAQFTHLTGIFSADDDRQARFYDRSNDKFIVVREGETLKYAGIDGFVMAIGRDFMLLQIKDQTFRLELGKHLRDLKKVENQPRKNVRNSSPIVPKPVAGP